MVHGNEFAKPLDEIIRNYLILIACFDWSPGIGHGAPPVSSSATNTSSILGAATATSVNGTPA